MHRALAEFKKTISEARELTVLHDFLLAQIKAPYAFDELLRLQLVYAVGAFDKLIHALVRIGIVNTYAGQRQPTRKYSEEPISMRVHLDLSQAGVPPATSVLESEIARKHSFLAFQDPDKVSDALSYIWDEKHKWQKIGDALSLSAEDTKTRLRLIVTRRNAIVHESDSAMLSNQKQPIDTVECGSSTDFIEFLGDVIHNFVK